MQAEQMPNDIWDYYSRLKKANKKKYGKYFKGLFHIHTPASHDYRLVENVPEGKNYSSKLKEQDIFIQCKRQSAQFNQAYQTINDVPFNSVFNSRKEQLAYMCLGLVIINNLLDFVVVTDHNTIEGSGKLETAVDIILGDIRKSVFKPQIMHGIEISCADKNHVVVIYDWYDQKTKDELRIWLGENIMSSVNGTHLTSLEVLEKFQGDHYISYIAHINTSDILSKDFLSYAFKHKLFSIGNKVFLGVSDIDKQKGVQDQVLSYVKDRDCIFFLDNDSHLLSELTHNITYMKCSRLTFRDLRSAVADYDTCFTFTSPKEPDKYISGIIAKPGRLGFLSGSEKNPEQPLIQSFAPAMNCLIGGRGTGKSTIINMLNLLLGGASDNDFILRTVCNHELIYILYYYNGSDYLIGYENRDLIFDEDIVKTLMRQSRESGIRSKAGLFNPFDDPLLFLQTQYIHVYRVDKDMNKKCWYLLSKAEKRSFLNKAFNRTYSINHIISLIERDRITDFIMSLLRKNPDLAQYYELTESDEIADVSLNTIHRLFKLAKAREERVNNVINAYNKDATNLRILLKQPNFGNFIDVLFPNMKSCEHEPIKPYNISYGEFATYLCMVFEKLNVINTISALSERKYSAILQQVPLYSFSDQPTIEQVNKGLERIIPENQQEALINICKTCFKSLDCFAECLEEHLTKQFEFDLLFDISSGNDNVKSEKNFRSITSLSFGQKVVAILSFILTYTRFCNDYSPLVIDQPEDNLDSQYIYGTLVDSLKRVKDERQVIVATHNATIVTNTKTEQVIVLQSDQNHGWVEMCGYPTQQRIICRILRYLEGGRRSFKHRERIYHDELN